MSGRIERLAGLEAALGRALGNRDFPPELIGDLDEISHDLGRAAWIAGRLAEVGPTADPRELRQLFTEWVALIAEIEPLLRDVRADLERALRPAP